MALPLQYLKAARWPGLVILIALIIRLQPWLQTVLIYNREAILEGEIWRLTTGHLVHFSSTQLFLDGAVFGVTAYIIESRRYPYLHELYLFSAVVISMLMLWLLPDMAYYGGLSGIAMATTTYLALHGLRESAPWRKLSTFVLVLIIVKMSMELSNEHLIFVDYENDAIATVSLSHLSGVVCAWIVYIWSDRINILINLKAGKLN
jgi:rhomboid family GlyGly-CTERM serine protease